MSKLEQKQNRAAAQYGGFPCAALDEEGSSLTRFNVFVATWQKFPTVRNGLLEISHKWTPNRRPTGVWHDRAVLSLSHLAG
jgi:hypothetical protein